MVFLVGGSGVSSFNDDEFAKVRQHFSLADDFLKDFDFNSLDVGGGKGGNLMGFTPDKQYLIKEVNATDHKTMLKIVKQFVAHLLDPEGSLLARIYAHFEKGTKKYLVMNNWMPPPRYEAAGDLAFEGFEKNFATYDLKGCADDKTLRHGDKPVVPVHKRFHMPHLWIGKYFWTKDRHKYFNGKTHAMHTTFKIEESSRTAVVARVTRDVKFLQDCALMDYSLVVSFHVLPRSAKGLADAVYAGTSDGGAQPFIYTTDKQIFVTYVGIIDYLQDWTCGKIVAQHIKCLESNKATIPPGPYGDRFLQFVKDKFTHQI